MLRFACSTLSTRASFSAYGCSCVPNPTTAAYFVLVDEALEAASDLAMLISGGRVHGICMKTVFPFGDGGGCIPPGGWGYDAAFEGMTVIPLRGPNTDVVSVYIDGVNLASNAYRLIDDSNLLRVDGYAWPSSNSFNPADTNSWSVTFRFGYGPDKLTRDAVNELACELIKTWTDRQSNLIPGITSLNLQGANAQLQDAADALRDGSENMPAVARFLGAYNPENYRNLSGVWSPELTRGWTLYESEGPSGS